MSAPLAKVTLADGRPAFTRDRRIWQRDIERYGSVEAARSALFNAASPVSPAGNGHSVTASEARGGGKGGS